MQGQSRSAKRAIAARLQPHRKTSPTKTSRRPCQDAQTTPHTGEHRQPHRPQNQVTGHGSDGLTRLKHRNGKNDSEHLKSEGDGAQRNRHPRRNSHDGDGQSHKRNRSSIRRALYRGHCCSHNLLPSRAATAPIGNMLTAGHPFGKRTLFPQIAGDGSR